MESTEHLYLQNVTPTQQMRIRQQVQNLKAQRASKEDRQKHLKIRKWQKSAARAAIKAQLLEDKLKQLIRDQRVSNRELLSSIQDALENEKVRNLLAYLKRDDKESEGEEEN